MKIGSQWIDKTEKYLILKLDQPFWSASQKYGFETQGEGFGISEAIVEEAVELKKKIMIKYRYGNYEISPKMVKKICKKYNSYFYTKNNVRLFIIPKGSCKRLPDNEEKIRAFNILAYLTEEQRKEIRIKLGLN